MPIESPRSLTPPGAQRSSDDRFACALGGFGPVGITAALLMLAHAAFDAGSALLTDPNLESRVAPWFFR